MLKFMNKKYNLFYLMFYLISFFFIFFLNSYYSLWVFMELNLILFISLMIMESDFLSDKIMKYYLMSSFSSMIFLFFINMNLFNLMSNYLFILNLMMMMKLGMFPFHLWFIDMIMGLNWFLCFFLMTFQKLIPLLILKNFYMELMIILFSIMNCLFSMMMSFNQIYLKKLIGYSSIIHLSWVMSSILISMKMWMIYFLFYLLMTMILMIQLNYFNLDMISDLYLYKNMNLFLLFFIMLSIGGVPPMFGYFIKLMFMMKYINIQSIIFLMILIFCSLIFLFFYMRLIYSIMMMKMEVKKNFLSYLFMKNMKFIYLIWMILLWMIMMIIWLI
uniref:NADH dehydrogenase subunit 2 n=1 Tax=Euurobracon yokahamae TaxID=2911681 RepID=UPI00207A59B8|nr:NADH dehydrogenase subunit 2 [Euurobracon yokahamae]UJJ81883.1 NADH dehydrogenase subunit 2 [Euurobracon yokahamae]